MSSPILEAVQLSRMVDTPAGRRPLLQGVDFRLEQAEVLALVGPSGAGKSTLLRMLNRLDEPSSGEILLAGVPYSSLDPRAVRRRVGMVMQRPYLFPGTAEMNIAYGPAQHGQQLSAAEVDELLGQVGMAGYRDRDAATLSGGEAQRISIARALANQPEVLLLDEPTSALDAEAKDGIERVLADLVRERQAACIWVTHDLDQAGRVANRVLKIEGGRAVALATPEQVFREKERH